MWTGWQTREEREREYRKYKREIELQRMEKADYANPKFIRREEFVKWITLESARLSDNPRIYLSCFDFGKVYHNISVSNWHWIIVGRIYGSGDYVTLNYTGDSSFNDPFKNAGRLECDQALGADLLKKILIAEGIKFDEIRGVKWV